MKTKTQISALQFYLMLFLSRVVVSMTINAQTFGGGNFLDTILSEILLFAVSAVFVLPLFALHRKYPELSLPGIAEKRFGAAGYGVSALYFLYFVLMNTFSLALFLVLILNTMDPAASGWSIVLVLSGIALYGAVKGIETVSRAAICIFAVFLLGIGAIFTALSGKVHPDYLEPILQNGTDQLLRGFWAFAARCTSLAEFAVLMPFVIQNKKKGFLLWGGGTALFLSVILFFLVSCLGEYADLQIFPFYTLSTMAEVAGIQRLDALLIGLCMMTLVIRLAVGFFAVSECSARLLQPRGRMILQLTVFGLCAAGALWITQTSSRSGLLFRTAYWLPGAVLTNAVLPVLIWLLDCILRKKKVI